MVAAPLPPTASWPIVPIMPTTARSVQLIASAHDAVAPAGSLLDRRIYRFSPGRISHACASSGAAVTADKPMCLRLRAADGVQGKCAGLLAVSGLLSGAARDDTPTSVVATRTRGKRARRFVQGNRGFGHWTDPDAGERPCPADRVAGKLGPRLLAAKTVPNSVPGKCAEPGWRVRC